MICLISFLLFPGCTSIPVPENGTTTSPLPRLNGSTAGEVAIGEQIHAQILSSFYAYTEPRMVAYLNKIGNSLVPFVERKELPYRFTLLYNDKIYATSAPGGFVYMTTGMINFLDNEAELAAVIAHEIGQLQYRDPRLSRSRKILEEITRTGVAVGPAFGQIGALAVLGLVMINMVVDNHTKTPEERIWESDSRTLHYLVSAGYDPQGLLDVLYKFLNADEKVLPYFYDYYQSRPITQERFLNVQKEFSELPLEGKSFSTNRKDYIETTKGIREMYKA